MSARGMAFAPLVVLGLTLGLALPPVHADVLFSETFDNGIDGWTTSDANKGESKYDGKWDVVVEPSTEEFPAENRVLVVSEASKHYCLSNVVSPPLKFGETDVHIQYTVQFTKTMSCGGSYLKLLSASPDLDLATVHDASPYTILFGPDMCGASQYLRFIFRYKNPVTGKYSEVHARRIQEPHKVFRDKKTHLLTLVLTVATNQFAIFLDEVEVLAGDLGAADRFEPALLPPAVIDDPNDFKPEDWVDAEFMDDPEETKPEAWVDDATIVDPEAAQPQDWDADMDGDWEAPEIKNPDFKGPWAATQIKNPAYQGVWEPKQVDNPEWFNETAPMAQLDPVSAVTFELWTTTSGITFDDIIITTDAEEARTAADHWRARRAYEDANDGVSPYAMFKKMTSTLWRKIVAMVSLVMDPVVFEKEAQPWIDAGIENPMVGGAVALVFLSPFFLLVYALCCRGGDDGYHDEDEPEGVNDDSGVSDNEEDDEGQSKDDEEENDGSKNDKATKKKRN